MDQVDFTVLAAKSVFTDMMDKCPPAETCRDAFDRTARATIKMASANGGFGSTAQAPRRQRAQSTTWGTNTESTIPTPRPQHRNRQSEHQPFNFDLSLSDTLSSPTLSVTGEMASRTPPLSQPKPFDTDYMMQTQNSHSPGEGSMNQDGSVGSSTTAGPRGHMGQQFGLQGSMDYPDTQTMEFLQTLGAAPNGEFGSMDQAHMDLGFGMNWEGMPNEFGDHHQMNPFDTFFFGGQQSGSGNGPNGGMGL